MATTRTPALPPRWFIRGAWVAHRLLYRTTRRGLRRPRPGVMGMLRLRTTGRRSGEERIAIIGYMEHAGAFVTLAMNGWAAEIISQEVADKVGKCWGMGSDTPKDPGPWEGELRNMWKPTQQTALWFHGGNLHQSRHYSLYLALQLKARMEGIDTPVYGLQPVHHLS